MKQEVVQRLETGDAVHPARLQAELREHRPQELRARHAGVQDQGGPVSRPELLEDRAADGRLPRADLAGDLDEALALPDAEQDVVEGLAVPLGKEEEPRVGRDVEGRLPESVELVVHPKGKLSHRPGCSEGAGNRDSISRTVVRFPRTLVRLRADATDVFAGKSGVFSSARHGPGVALVSGR